jgi:curved DNA-binding protein CbpA
MDGILGARDLFGRFGWSVGPVEVDHVRKQYRVLARTVHPDKCDHPRATEAFQLLSEAFDVLADPQLQKEYIRELQLKLPVKCKKRKKEKETWWREKSWEQVERELKRREQEEMLMRSRFVRAKSQHFAHRKQKNMLMKAFNVLKEFIPDYDEQDQDIDDEQINAKLKDCTKTLRNQFHYCIYCGIHFRDDLDMQNTCPGTDEDLHG